MKIEEFLEYVAETYPNAIILDGLNDGIVGIDIDGHVVYSYDKCVDCMIKQGMTDEDAMEWVDYNTIRAIPYMGENRPIMMYERDFLG
jgi:hypothetical protein